MSKTVDGVEHQYIFDGTQLLRESWGNNWIEYFYDENGSPTYCLRYDENDGDILLNFYITNLQGDVIAVCDNTHVPRFFYHYDAWGKLLSVTNTNGDDVTNATNAASWNSLRYRGYVYDKETGLYYVSSRYYDPEIGRFINADHISYLGINDDFSNVNLYVYCGNNPVMREDVEGNFWINILAGLGTQYVSDVIGNLIDGKTGIDIFKPTSSPGEYIAAAVTSLIPVPGIGGAFVRNVVTVGITTLEDAIVGEDINIKDKMVDLAVGTVIDTYFETASDYVVKNIKSLEPRNYSSYAHSVRKTNPNLSREQIYRSMQRSIRTNRIVSKVASVGISICRAAFQEDRYVQFFRNRI